MTRRENDTDPRLRELFGPLRSRRAPGESEFRELARTATAHPRPAHELPPSRRIHRSPSLRRLAFVAGIALLVGSAIGFGLGAAVTPAGNAASVTGLGFVPEPGWRVLQSGTDSGPERSALAIASNVPLARVDDARGVGNSSGLPYATLVDLPANGIVIVATFTVPGPATPSEEYPARSLPLRLRDATPFVQQGAQIRPERPLGEYQLRAHVSGRDVDVELYFGVQKPPSGMVTAAQEQLDRLVVALARSTTHAEERALPLRSSDAGRQVAAVRVMDRTISCTTGFGNGTRNVTVNAISGFRKAGVFEWPGQATVTTPGSPLPKNRDQYLPTLAGVTAGWPPKPPLRGNGVGFSASLCKATKASVPFSKRGLGGGAASQFGDEVTCFPLTTVLIHLRAEFAAPTTLELTGKKNFRFFSATGHVTKARLAARTLRGKPLVYADVAESGEARVFTARSCV